MTTNGIGADHLRSFIQRIERLEEDLTGLKQDRAEIYSELKGEGFDPKIVRMIVRRRKRDPQEVREEEEIMALYLEALGDTPLEAAISRSSSAGEPVTIPRPSEIATNLKRVEA